jgi:adenylyltransferase/sulfurtransferase
MTLSDEELERYARHIVLRDVGGPGQGRLRQARVLVVGAGGLGAPVLMYLAAAGIGTLGIVDNDTVSLSNLQRQVIHRTEDVGRAKTRSAQDAIARLNPGVQVVAHEERLTAANALELIGAYDIVADGTDNFAARYLISDACHLAARPLVTAAVAQFDGYLTTLRSFEKDAGGTPRPTYRCLFPQPPAEGIAPSCEEAGILGALTGIIGSLQAMEVIKELLGLGEGLTGRLLTYDARDVRFHEVRYAWDASNPLNGTGATITDLSAHA